jgi:threonine/homoserine/homoserine lactone efflux protein
MPDASPFAVFLFACAISLGAVVSPGPVSAAIISEAPRKGWRVGPLIATGHVLLEMIFILLICLGLSTGLAKGGIQRVIAIVGSLLLFYMGGSYIALVLRGKARLPLTNLESKKQKKSSLILLGTLTTISNPFWYAWWTTVVPGYLGQLEILDLSTILAFYFGHISIDYAWDSLLSIVLVSGRRWLSDRGYALLILITGAFMIYLGLSFLRAGLGT